MTCLSFRKKEHLVDVLLNEGVNVIKVFSPEHGFRGKADAGELVKDGKDIKTGLDIYSFFHSLTSKKAFSNQLDFKA